MEKKLTPSVNNRVMFVILALLLFIIYMIVQRTHVDQQQKSIQTTPKKETPSPVTVNDPTKVG